MVQGRQILMFYNNVSRYNILVFWGQSAAYIKTVHSATDLVGYSSQLSIVGILIESIAEQRDEQRCHTARSWTLVDLWAGGGGAETKGD